MEADSIRIVLLLMIYARLCLYHEIFGLLFGLACGTYDILCFVLATMLGKKEACFLMVEKSGKIVITMVPSCYSCFNV